VGSQWLWSDVSGALGDTGCRSADIYDYGPCQDMGKLIPSVIVSLQESRSPRLSSGRWQADWIYVDDVIDGFLAAAQRPDIEGCTLDLGSGTLISVRAIVEQLVAIMRPSVQPWFGALPDSPLKPECSADVVDLEEKLGWRPAKPARSPIRRAVEETQKSTGQWCIG
jgi:UDP-glucose 4-epimerase